MREENGEIYVEIGRESERQERAGKEERDGRSAQRRHKTDLSCRPLGG